MEGVAHYIALAKATQNGGAPSLGAEETKTQKTALEALLRDFYMPEQDPAAEPEETAQGSFFTGTLLATMGALSFLVAVITRYRP